MGWAGVMGGGRLWGVSENLWTSCIIHLHAVSTGFKLFQVWWYRRNGTYNNWSGHFQKHGVRTHG